MFDGTLNSDDAKWKSFSNQVKAQFQGNDGGLTLEGFDLAFFQFAIPSIFMWLYSVLPKTTAMTILDNSPASYDSKYKQVCDLLKKLFARHLKLYGHIRHSKIAKILFHEINVHAKKILELAKEFDKIDPVEKMVIIIDALKNREQRDRI
nr:hypothetical protein [Tanacetum cinerariifolium]